MWWTASLIDLWTEERTATYGWIALSQKVREEGRIVNVSVAVATAVNAEGRREIIGMDVERRWSRNGMRSGLALLRKLSARGLSVELVIS